MIEERTLLMQNVYPELREYCRHKYGLEFQVRDVIRFDIPIICARRSSLHGA